MKKGTVSFKKIVSDSRFIMAFSVLLSFVLWLVITLDKNPIRQATFSNVAIDIDVKGAIAGDMSLDISSKEYTKSVAVTVEGPNYIVSSLKSSDIKVYADLSGVTDAGTYTIPLIAQRANDTSGYTILNVSPEYIQVTFDYFDSREFPVEVIADGVLADSDLDLVRDQPVVSSAGDSTIIVRGIKNELDAIDSVVAFVNAKETLEASKTYDADILLYDTEGNLIDSNKFTLSAQKVKVTVPIYKQKVLPVVASFSNEPYEGFGNNLKVSLSEKYVTVKGPQTIIDSLDKVNLKKIDFSKVSVDNNKFDVGLSLPDGVQVVGDIDHVTVSFNLAGYSTKTITVSKSNVIFKNASGVNATVNADLKNVLICGTGSNLNKVNANDFYIEIDLAGKSAGAYEVNAVVHCKDKIGVWQVGTYTVTVTVK